MDSVRLQHLKFGFSGFRGFRQKRFRVIRIQGIQAKAIHEKSGFTEVDASGRRRSDDMRSHKGVFSINIMYVSFKYFFCRCERWLRWKQKRRSGSMRGNEGARFLLLFNLCFQYVPFLTVVRCKRKKAKWRHVEVQRMTQNDGIPSNGGVHFLLLNTEQWRCAYRAMEVFNFVYEWCSFSCC